MQEVHELEHKNRRYSLLKSSRAIWQVILAYCIKLEIIRVHGPGVFSNLREFNCLIRGILKFVWIWCFRKVNLQHYIFIFEELMQLKFKLDAMVLNFQNLSSFSFFSSLQLKPIMIIRWSFTQIYISITYIGSLLHRISKLLSYDFRTSFTNSKSLHSSLTSLKGPTPV